MLETVLVKKFTSYLEKVIHTKVIKFLIIKAVTPKGKLRTYTSVAKYRVIRRYWKLKTKI